MLDCVLGEMRKRQCVDAVQDVSGSIIFDGK
jgi:hypothetical protein